MFAGIVFWRVGIIAAAGVTEQAFHDGANFYGFATVAIMNAAAASGFLSTYIARQMTDAEPGMRDMWHALFHFNGQVNQTFALLFVVASSAAIVLWSVSILKSKEFAASVGIYGCILGPVTLIAVLSGHVTLGVHGFGMIVLCQVIWYVAIGVRLWRHETI